MKTCTGLKEADRFIAAVNTPVVFEQCSSLHSVVDDSLASRQKMALGEVLLGIGYMVDEVEFV